MIVVVCGPPAAGKTTVATLLRDRLGERGLDVRLLDSDEFSRNTYERTYGRVGGSDEDRIVAGTFYEERWQERFAGLEDAFVAYLRADVETCLDRNRRRERSIDERGVHVVHREFDEPDADVTVDVTERSPEDVVDVLLAELPSNGK